MLKRFKGFFKKASVSVLTLGLLMGSVNMPTHATESTSQDYTKVTAPNGEGKVDQTLVPRGANMDEVVEVIIQFEGNPVLKEFNNAKAQGEKLGKEKQAQHAKGLVNAKKKAKDQILKNNGKVIDSFEKVYNGLYAQVERSALADLANLQEVQGVFAVNPVELHNASSGPFIGASEVWEQTIDGVNVTGEGVTVAVIDTGIDYTHAAFGGEGTPEAYEEIDKDVVEEGTFPTAKIVGGHDFVGTNYDASSDVDEIRIPQPDANPIDEHGHGTHVAATIAGMEVEQDNGSIGKGIAPDALLYAYKVFGESGSTGVTVQALEMAMDPNGDGDVSDHVDVVNMSLGSSYGHPEDPSAVATDLAVDAGVIVVASAGNSGNVPYITGSPAVAEKAISVAASVHDGVVVGAVQVNSPEAIAGQYEAVEGAISTPLSEAGPITNDVVYIGRGCVDDEISGDPAGKIAMIDRGECAFTDKLQTALDLGAEAVVVANNSPGEPITMGGDDVAIPAVMVSKATGDTMKAELANGDVNITLSDEIQIPKPELADTLADFSSKGPGGPNSLFKPEVSAPGFNIYSAASGTGNGGTLMSGTSMAAPQVAGVAALLRQLRPDWSADDVKSLIMNTSTPIQNLADEVYPLSLQGAGRVQADVAANTTSVVSPQALSLGHVPVSEDVQVTKNEEVTVTNKGSEDKEYEVSWTNRHGNKDGAVSLSVPNSLRVKAGKSGNLKVDFAIDSDLLDDEAGFHEFDGFVHLAEKGGGEQLTIPYQAVVEKVSHLDVSTAKDMLKLKNKGATASETDLFTLGEKSSANAEVRDYIDIRAVGARSSEGVTEFAIATESPWATMNVVEFNVYIDNNMDGDADFIVYNYDWYAYFGLDPIGKQLSLVYDIATGESHIQALVDVGGSWNHSMIALPVFNEDVEIESEFQYMVTSFDAVTELPDSNEGGWISFDPEEPGLEFETSSLSVPANTEEEVYVTSNGNQEKALILNNSEPHSQYDIAEFATNRGNDSKEKGQGKGKGKD